MKFRIRTDEKGEFEILNVRIIEARARSILAKTTVIGGMVIFVFAAGYFALSSDGGGLKTVLNLTMPLIGAVMWYYFRRPDG